jgi:hypothetical protein
MTEVPREGSQALVMCHVTHIIVMVRRVRQTDLHRGLSSTTPGRSAD